MLEGSLVQAPSRWKVEQVSSLPRKCGFHGFFVGRRGSREAKIDEPERLWLEVLHFVVARHNKAQRRKLTRPYWDGQAGEV